MSKPKRSSKHISISAAYKQLLELARCWDDTMSVYEEKFYEREIKAVLTKVFGNPNKFAVEELLERLHAEHPASYVVYEVAEEMSEHTLIDLQGETLDCVIFSMPTVVWSRYGIPKPQANDKIREAVLNGLKRYILSPGTQVVMMPAPTSGLSTPKQLSTTRKWLQTLAQRLEDTNAPLPTPADFHEVNLFADAQHWVFVAANQTHVPVLRRMSHPTTTQQRRLKDWKAHMEGIYKALYPSCQIDIFLPDLLGEVVEAVRIQEQIRNIHTTIDRIEITINQPREQIQANVMRVVNEGFEEYRIGFNLQDQSKVIYGTSWFILSDNLSDEFGDFDVDDEFLMHEFDDIADEMAALSKDFEFFDNLDIDGDEQDLEDISTFTPDLETILETLTECGVNHINVINAVAPAMECPDCETPLFPGPSGFLQHLEAPDDMIDIPTYLH